MYTSYGKYCFNTSCTRGWSALRPVSIVYVSVVCYYVLYFSVVQCVMLCDWFVTYQSLCIVTHLSNAMISKIVRHELYIALSLLFINCCNNKSITLAHTKTNLQHNITNLICTNTQLTHIYTTLIHTYNKSSQNIISASKV